LIDKPQLIATDDVLRTLQPSGAWTVANVEPLEQLYDIVPHAHARAIDLSPVTTLDTVGAWLLEKLAWWSCELSAKTSLIGVSPSYAGLMQEMRDLNRRRPTARRRDSAVLEFVERLGRSVASESASFLQMLGAVGIALLGVVRHPRSLRLTSTVYRLYKVGWQAIPIMALITFLIGARSDHPSVRAYFHGARAQMLHLEAQ
jgi:phospholipid/cholesterol/gamma-HCH transport system permease protein